MNVLAPLCCIFYVSIFYTSYCLLLAHHLSYTCTKTIVFQALMLETSGSDYLAVAWKYPGQDVEVIPAIHSRMAKPGWPATCANDSDCDDGVWCNGKLYYHQCPISTSKRQDANNCYCLMLCLLFRRRNLQW